MSVSWHLPTIIQDEARAAKDLFVRETDEVHEEAATRLMTALQDHRQSSELKELIVRAGARRGFLG